MGKGAGAVAALALLELSICACAASCGIDTSGLAGATHDGGATTTSDATGSKDAGGGGSDAPGSEGQVDASIGDAPTASDVQQGVDGPPEDAPSPVDVASEGPPPPTCTGCGGNQCCNGGTCANIGNTTCGDPGKSCVDCTNSPLGNQCLKLMGRQTCGCVGPASPDQCPLNNACHNQQCGTSCDGQHPCNGGCCSGNDLASSTCVTGCEGGATCQGNFCQ